MKTLPEFKLAAAAADRAASGMEFAAWSDPHIGTRHKIGGQPDFIQPHAWPDCPICKHSMSFYGQFDSLNDKDGEYDIGDCGMLYVFFCFDCNEGKTVVQCS